MKWIVTWHRTPDKCSLNCVSTDGWFLPGTGPNNPDKIVICRVGPGGRTGNLWRYVLYHEWGHLLRGAWTAREYCRNESIRGEEEAAATRFAVWRIRDRHSTRIKGELSAHPYILNRPLTAESWSWPAAGKPGIVKQTWAVAVHAYYSLRRAVG